MDARIKSGHDGAGRGAPMSQRLAMVTLGLSLLSPHAAQAQDRAIGFLTPSKNIACQFFTNTDDV
ncbi:hypothetical protein XH96_36535 [Bradyrhizobium sp. CCBAU 51765]|nr:hypothetical protein XH96_36535 [Bradyrhizobium sp. CCBAU 51765]